MVFCHIWISKYIISHFWEIFYIHKDCLIFTYIYNNFWKTNNQIYEQNFSSFYRDIKKLKLHLLIKINFFGSLLNQAKTKICVQMIVYIWPKIFVIGNIIHFFDGQMILKKLSWHFFKRFFRTASILITYKTYYFHQNRPCFIQLQKLLLKLKLNSFLAY